jgi:hypothetical protein
MSSFGAGILVDRRQGGNSPVAFSHGFRPFFLGGAVFFATFARERPDALFVAPNAFFLNRRLVGPSRNQGLTADRKREQTNDDSRY